MTRNNSNIVMYFAALCNPMTTCFPLFTIFTANICTSNVINSNSVYSAKHVLFLTWYAVHTHSHFNSVTFHILYTFEFTPFIFMLFSQQEISCRLNWLLYSMHMWRTHACSIFATQCHGEYRLTWSCCDRCAIYILWRRLFGMWVGLVQWQLRVFQ